MSMEADTRQIEESADESNPRMHVRVALFNWRVLASRNGKMRLEKLMDGLAATNEKNVDVLLSNELGTSDSTPPLESDMCDADWTFGRPGIAGLGVGAFFLHKIRGFWARIDTGADPPNCRHYLVKGAVKHLVLTVFYAPHAGHPSPVRINYYARLKDSCRRVRCKYPDALWVLAGDANLPTLLHKDAIALTPSNDVENYFVEHFCQNLSLPW